MTAMSAMTRDQGDLPSPCVRIAWNALDTWSKRHVPSCPGYYFHLFPASAGSSHRYHEPAAKLSRLEDNYPASVADKVVRYHPIHEWQPIPAGDATLLRRS